MQRALRPARRRRFAAFFLLPTAFSPILETREPRAAEPRAFAAAPSGPRRRRLCSARVRAGARHGHEPRAAELPPLAVPSWRGGVEAITVDVLVSKQSQAYQRAFIGKPF